MQPSKAATSPQRVGLGSRSYHTESHPVFGYSFRRRCRRRFGSSLSSYGELCHRNALVQSFTASLESFLSNAIFRTQL